MSKEIIFFSRFILDENGGGGGCRREAQLGDILAPLDYRFVTWRDSDWFSNRLTKAQVRRFDLEKKYHPYKNYWIDYFIDSAFKMKAAARAWKEDIKRGPRPKLVIIDDPIYFYPLVEYLHGQNVPIVGLCQNIESLSFSQVNHKKQAQFLIKELRLLKKCALVVTISREETFLLNNFDIPTHYFPYYPVESITERLLAIRKRRGDTPKKDFLMIGNAANKVTRDGMATFIEAWKKNPGSQEKLIVAGYWTEQFLKVRPGKNVELLGEISNEELDDLSTRIKAMICYQEHGSGALTKIREMLLAGVPILANPHAARSYREFLGVVEFSRPDLMDPAIKELEQRPVQPLEPVLHSKPSADRLIERIRSII